MWWSGNQEGYGGVGELVNEELYDKVEEIRRINDRVMSLAIVLYGEVVRMVCTYASQSGKSIENFLQEYLSKVWTTHHMSELIIRMGDLNRHVGRNIDVFQGSWRI